jgi:hypothetical protein
MSAAAETNGRIITAAITSKVDFMTSSAVRFML